MEVEFDNENGVALGSGATFNGSSYNQQSAGNRYAQFRVVAVSDVGGTINVQQSFDGITWYTTLSQPITAGATLGTVVGSMWSLPYIRVSYVNGATAQTVFKLATDFIMGYP